MFADESTYLEKLAADPSHQEIRLEYLQWLTQREDPRADYLSLVECLAAESVRTNYLKLRSQLLETVETIPVEWRMAVGRRFNVVIPRDLPGWVGLPVHEVLRTYGCPKGYSTRVDFERGELQVFELLREFAELLAANLDALCAVQERWVKHMVVPAGPTLIRSA